MAAVNGKVSNHIPDDFAFNILSKLPVKSLTRFGCVHKSWSLLFENHHFMTMFRKNLLSKDHSYNNDTSLLLLQVTSPFAFRKYVLYSLFGEKFENRVQLDWPNLFQEGFWFSLYEFAVNGILCIESIGRMDGMNPWGESVGRPVLWNPATEEFKVISLSPFAFESHCWDPMIDLHGFGYDQVRDDYKLIRYVSFDPMTDEDYEETWKNGYLNPLWEIYSLKSNSWRKLDIDMPRYYAYGGDVSLKVYMNGVCHWWGESETYDESEINDESNTNNEVYLVSYDLSNETFVCTIIPSNMYDIDPSNIYRYLVLLNGSIGWISKCTNTTTLHISVLGEVGVKESWTKLFVVEMLPSIGSLIGVDKNSDLFFRKNGDDNDDDELIWFNLSNQRIEELGIKGAEMVVVYKESLLPIERAYN